MRRTMKMWAVVDATIWKKDGYVFNLMYTLPLERFAQAIFNFEDVAQLFADRMTEAGKQLVVPVTVTYTLPSRVKKSKRTKMATSDPLNQK